MVVAKRIRRARTSVWTAWAMSQWVGCSPAVPPTTSNAPAPSTPPASHSTVVPTASSPVSPGDAKPTGETTLERRTIDRALALREGGTKDEAARLLLDWLCPGPASTRSPSALASCRTARSAGEATAWLLLGDLAFEWAAVDNEQGLTLQHAEVAYTKALAPSPSRVSPEVPRYKRAWTRYRLERYALALADFVEVIRTHGASSVTIANEAVAYAAVCISEADWNHDQRPDRLRLFERPEVAELLGSSEPWVADIMAQVTTTLIDAQASDARRALEAWRGRFPRDARIAESERKLATPRP